MIEVIQIVRDGSTKYPDIYTHEPTTPREVRKQRMLDVLHAQAESPPGNDTFVPLAYRAAANNTGFIDMLLDCQDERRQSERPLTYPHAVQLGAMVAINYMMLKRGNLSYPYDPSINLDAYIGWERLYAKHLAEDEYEMRQLIVNGDIQTTNSNRAVAVPDVLNTLYPDADDLSVVDLGCSANIVLGRLLEEQPFVVDVDATYAGENHRAITSAKPVAEKIKLAVGVDRHFIDTNDTESLMWLAACQHFDQMNHENVRRILDAGEGMNERSQRAQYLQADILKLPIAMNSVDVVTIFTTLYQFPTKLAQEVVNNALRICSDRGVVVLQEYCTVEEDEDGKRSIVLQNTRDPYTYSTVVFGPRTGNQVYQVAKFADTTCQVIENGDHRGEFICDFGRV